VGSPQKIFDSSRQEALDKTELEKVLLTLQRISERASHAETRSRAAQARQLIQDLLAYVARLEDEVADLLQPPTQGV
jgi:hypothetical protein